MTKSEAKDTALELWGYLAEHPECKRKQNVPRYILNKIKSCLYLCPLCEAFMADCADCVLHKAGEGCKNAKSAWMKWRNCRNGDATRIVAAKKIFAIVSEWCPINNKANNRR